MAKLALSNTTSSLSEIFDDPGFGLADDIFSVLENLDNFDDFCSDIHKTDEEAERQKSKRQKIVGSVEDTPASFGEQKNISHITVERNRRKQMNEHLTVLRSLMPCFYVKRGDQASIIGGVVDYIKELQQVLNSLEARKHRKSYNIEVLSPRLIPSPRVLPLSPLSPKKPPLSPRVNLPISPRTPTSPYKPLMIPQVYHFSPTIHDLSPSLSSPSTTNSTIDNANELVANSKSGNADVEVKFCGPNVLLKTVSGKIPGQALKIVSAIEEMSLEILNVSIGTVDEALVNSFTIKIGIECELSAEELAHRIQQTFC